MNESCVVNFSLLYKANGEENSTPGSNRCASVLHLAEIQLRPYSVIQRQTVGFSFSKNFSKQPNWLKVNFERNKMAEA